MPRKAPFSAEVLGLSETDFDPTDTLLLPASTREILTLGSPAANIYSFLQMELSCIRLNKIDEYLWVAGVRRPPAPLNFRVATSREIVPDERIDMHLVWENSQRIHLKPIPRYLLNHRFWDSHFICQEPCQCISGFGDCARAQGDKKCLQKELYEYALGFLYSYIALIRSESDFVVALDHHLLPGDVKWEEWVTLAQQLLGNGAADPKNINARYLFGELRLFWLNFICACCQNHDHHFYIWPYRTTGEFIRNYLTLLTAATIYIALVLTAMQVGLATTHLSDSIPFQRASYGFTVFSILGPLIALLLLGLFMLFNFVSTLERLDPATRGPY